MKSAAPSVLEIASSGPDGVVFKIVDMDLTCNGKFDGKDHPCSGPTLGPGWTASFAKAGPRTLDMNVKNNGKAFFRLLSLGLRRRQDPHRERHDDRAEREDQGGLRQAITSFESCGDN